VKPFEWARLVCDDERVPPMSRFVAMTIAMHARGAHAPQSRCSHAQVAGWTGLSKRTVVSALATLVELEYLISLRQHSKSGARAASLHLLIHPEIGDEPVDNPTPKRATKVQQVHQPSAGGALRSVRAQETPEYGSDLRRRSGNLSAPPAPLEDKEELQDAPHVLDFVARLAASKGMP
jgi:hypothetical protein